MDVLVGNGLACRDVAETEDYASLEDGWSGGEQLDHTSVENMWLLINTFVPDQEKLRRMRAAYYMMPVVFADIARLEYQRTGQAIPVPVALVKELQRRLLVALEPSVREVVEQSEHLQASPAGVAARELRRVITAREGWRKR